MTQPIEPTDNRESVFYGAFSPLADLIVVDTEFPDGLSKYIHVGVAGDIVFENKEGVPQFIKNIGVGTILPIVAKKIVAGPVNVRGIARSTTASELSWLGGY